LYHRWEGEVKTHSTSKSGQLSILKKVLKRKRRKTSGRDGVLEKKYLNKTHSGRKRTIAPTITPKGLGFLGRWHSGGKKLGRLITLSLKRVSQSRGEVGSKGKTVPGGQMGGIRREA